MFRVATDIIIPEFLEEEINFPIDNIDGFLSKIKQDARNLPFRFTTVEGLDKQTGKSGSALLRDLKNGIQFDKNLTVSPWELKNLSESIKAIIIVDDVIGSGQNFKTFYTEYIQQNPRFKFLFIPLAAYDKTILNLQKDYPDIKFAPIERLSDTNSFFFEPSLRLKIDEQQLRKIYSKIMEQTKLNKDKIWGHENLSFTHFFSGSTPNINLPIFYYCDENWKNLLQR